MACMILQECGKRGIRHFRDSVASFFTKFVFSREHEGYTLIFHNGSSYDLYFIAKYIFGSQIQMPNVIYRGAKIVSIDTGKIRVINSLNFLT